LGSALVLVGLLAGCMGQSPHAPAVTSPIDAPGVPGPGTFTTFDFDLGTETFDGANGVPLTMHLRGSMHLPDGQGPFPILVFAHGLHAACNFPLVPKDAFGSEGTAVRTPTAVCPELNPVVEPADSFRGYDYLSDGLSARGYIVISLDFAEVNAAGSGPSLLVSGTQDYEIRANMVLHTLDHLRDGTAASNPTADPTARLAGHLDFGRIGVMGHSRGGQGIDLVVKFNNARPEAQRHHILAAFGLAPADDAAMGVVMQGVAYGVLLPYCDGDIVELHGANTFDRARYLDDPAPKYQFLVLGTNHNFYNTQWAQHKDDRSDFTDPFCGRFAPQGGFFTVDQTLPMGRAIMDAFFRAHVGGETALLPYLEGRLPFPEVVCPMPGTDEVRFACSNLIQVAYHPGVKDRAVLAESPGKPASGPYVSTQATSGNLHVGNCDPSTCKNPNTPGLAESFGFDGQGTWRHTLPESGRDWSGFQDLSLRVASREISPDGMPRPGPPITALIEDGGGHSARLTQDPGIRAGPVAAHNVTFNSQPNEQGHAVLTDLVFNLRQARDAGIDMRDVRTLTFTIEDSIIVADVMLRA
jgi:hypothetical protein